MASLFVSKLMGAVDDDKDGKKDGDDKKDSKREATKSEGSSNRESVGSGRWSMGF